ncbi:MAG: hypothetical protein EAZ27_03920 [Cytophagales bacterium]|nr:MAG: hypothetical protein EAZ27_03920 [Cytophagales bacterium]
MKKVILIASVAVISVLASCSSKTNCVCTDSAGKEVSNNDFSKGSSSEREEACKLMSSLSALSGGKCELK